MVLRSLPLRIEVVIGEVDTTFNHISWRGPLPRYPVDSIQYGYLHDGENSSGRLLDNLAERSATIHSFRLGMSEST